MAILKKQLLDLVGSLADSLTAESKRDFATVASMVGDVEAQEVPEPGQVASVVRALEFMAQSQPETIADALLNVAVGVVALLPVPEAAAS